MKVIGHRGVCGLEPENTLRSFKRAFDLGLEIIELDIHWVDKQLLVIHDSDLNRTTNGSGSIYAHQLDYLRRLDAGLGEKLPFLEEVFAITPSHATINIELKGRACAAPLARLLSTPQWSKGKYLVSSFHWDDLIEFHSLQQDIPIGVLIPSENEKLDAALELAAKLQAFSIHPPLAMLDTPFVKKAQALKLKVLPFTVKSLKDYQKLQPLGVDGFFSDDPTLHP